MLISEHQQQQQHSDIFAASGCRRAEEACWVDARLLGMVLKGVCEDVRNRNFWSTEKFCTAKETFRRSKSFFSMKMNDRNSSVKERLLCT